MVGKRPKLKLPRLRDIGWSLWDPIGLLEKGEAWEGQAFEGEYDSYLIRAAGMVRNGENTENIIDYLYDIEINHMGLGAPVMERIFCSRIKSRIAIVVDAISKDTELWSS